MQRKMREMSIAALGEIVFKKSERSRSLRVKILPGGLEVIMPGFLSKQHALDFLHKNMEKIMEKQKQANSKLQLTRLNPDQELNTFSFQIRFQAYERNILHYKLSNEVLTIEHPRTLDFQTLAVQQQLWKGISHFLRLEAKRILPEKTLYFADVFGFTVNSIKIKAAKTRWGSCSQHKNINLSLYLLLLPEHLIDYVVLHELCHTREMNHGDKFWKLMDEVTGGKSKKLRAEMKKYHMPS